MSTQGIAILSGVVCRLLCVIVVTNRVTGQNLKSHLGIDLLFFLKLRITEEKCRVETNFERCEKKVRNRQKRCEVTNLGEFSIENLCKTYIFL